MIIHKIQLYCAYNRHVCASVCDEKNNYNKSELRKSANPQLQFGADVSLFRGFVPTFAGYFTVVKDSFLAFFQAFKSGVKEKREL